MASVGACERARQRVSANLWSEVTPALSAALAARALGSLGALCPHLDLEAWKEPRVVEGARQQLAPGVVTKAPHHPADVFAQALDDRVLAKSATAEGVADVHEGRQAARHKRLQTLVRRGRGICHEAKRCGTARMCVWWCVAGVKWGGAGWDGVK